MRNALRATPVDPDILRRLIGGEHHDPHSVLGAHPGAGGVTVRTLRPAAEHVVVVTDTDRVELSHEAGGLFSGMLPVDTVPDYRLEVTYPSGRFDVDDPYRYLPTLGAVDQHLFNEGRHERLWEVLGAHVRSYDTPRGPVTGTSFAVWAPNARGVRVVGDFNFWDGHAHPMRSLGASGVWELFVPGVGDGTLYKYDVLGRDGVWRHKADPMAFYSQLPPSNASVVYTSGYDWKDAEWLEHREHGDRHTEPMSIYEVHLGSWQEGRSYRQLADELTDYVAEAGFTHVEFLPVAEHPYGGSWGYQVSSYFAPTSRLGAPDDLRYLIDRLHGAGIGVIMDWVPAHFPRDAWALARFDGTALYEHEDPRLGEHPDWGTYVFDFGRPEVRNFLVANAIYWCEQFHVDGLRVDAVASMLYLDYSREHGEWVPNVHGGRENLDAEAFLQEMNATVRKRVPGVVTIAEESTSWPGVTAPTDHGGLGFDFKWNMGWMHDALGYVARDPIHRQYHHNAMTFAMAYAYSEKFILPISHDEVVHGKGSLLRKMPGDRWRQLATTRAFLAFMWAHPGKQMLFMGQEFAQEREWAEQRGLDWWLAETPDHQGMSRLVRDLNRVYRGTPALWEQDYDPEGFRWIDADDASRNVFTFVRFSRRGDALACLVNFAAQPWDDYRVGLPYAGTWEEAVNTDATDYAGSGVGNMGQVTAEPVPWNHQPASAVLRLPPLGALWLYRAAPQ